LKPEEKYNGVFASKDVICRAHAIGKMTRGHFGNINQRTLFRLSIRFQRRLLPSRIRFENVSLDVSAISANAGMLPKSAKCQRQIVLQHGQIAITACSQSFSLNVVAFQRAFALDELHCRKDAPDEWVQECDSLSRKFE
jgi:hypothetical protein